MNDQGKSGSKIIRTGPGGNKPGPLAGILERFLNWIAKGTQKAAQDKAGCKG